MIASRWMPPRWDRNQCRTLSREFSGSDQPVDKDSTTELLEFLDEKL